jgi:hypothetical protein
LTTRAAPTEFKGNERFFVESILGQGGMGVVYRARDLQRGSVVALKTMGRYLFACLHALKAEREQALEQLALAIAGLSHFDMGYLANCAKARRGALAGGEAGRMLVQESTQRLREQGVVNVERCLDMTAPGFSRSLAS